MKLKMILLALVHSAIYISLVIIFVIAIIKIYFINRKIYLIKWLKGDKPDENNKF